MGRVLGSSQLIGPSTFSFNYTYDLAGDLLSQTYPTGRTLWNGFDGAGRVNSVRGSTPGGQWTNYVNVGGYWPHGALYYSFYGNNVVPVYAYNNRLQMNDAYASVGGDGNRFLAVWEMNWGSTQNNGTLQTVVERYGNQVPYSSMGLFAQYLAYDKVNRIAAESDTGGWSRYFYYDKTGNSWVAENSGVPLMGNTPTSNVYSNNMNRIDGQNYDAAGNQLSANGDSLSYDAENRLTLATEPVYLGGGSENYFCDGLGQRTYKTRPSESLVYVYDAFGALAAKYGAWDTVQQEYVRMGGQLVATENSGASPCQTCYFVRDHLGSTRLVTDQNANVVARHDYLPFGEEIPGGWAGRSSEWGATNDTNEKFTGQLRDLETGLDYFHARYLSSSLGRFTSPDPGNAGANPYDPQSWNGYSYARNNPLALVDPSGMIYGSGSGDDGGCDDDPFCGGDYPPPPPSDPTPPPVITTQEEPVPRGSFPGGETLGLPPGVQLPGPFEIGIDPFVFSVCSAAEPNCMDSRFWNFYLARRQANIVGAISLFVDFVTGRGETNRSYSNGDWITQDLMNSGGFRLALRNACRSGRSSGPFNVTTGEAAGNLSHDATYSPTGVQVGGYLGNYICKGNSMQISISNDAGAKSFFYHGAPNSPFASGPFRTINQQFDINVPHGCGG